MFEHDVIQIQRDIRRSGKHALKHTFARGFVSGKLSPFFGSRVGRLPARDAETLSPCPSPAACASLWRQPSSLAMTHMRWRWAQCGHESTDFTLLCGPRCWWVVKSGPSICARTRARAEVNVSPQPLVKTTGVTQAIANIRAETTANTETSTCKHEDRHSDWALDLFCSCCLVMC